MTTKAEILDFCHACLVSRSLNQTHMTSKAEKLESCHACLVPLENPQNPTLTSEKVPL